MRSILTGYASMWLPALTLAWTVAAGIMARSVSPLHVHEPWTEIPAAALAALTPVAVTAMAPRLATGLGEAVGSIRDDRPDARCETCGYNLHATAPDRLCPECGRPAIESYSTATRCNGAPG